jgi:hypothetical protein
MTRGLLGFKTFYDCGLGFGSFLTLISKCNTYGNPPLPPTMHSHATQVKLLLTFLEWCSILCSTNSWAKKRMFNKGLRLRSIVFKACSRRVQGIFNARPLK